jgi:probable rRNA maturation factor
MIHLDWENEQNLVQLPPEWEGLLEQLNAIIATEEQLEPGEVSLLIVDNATIQQYNADYRGMDKATDVLSFAIQEEHQEDLDIVYDDEDEQIPNLYGDIIISAERAVEQANDYGHSLLRELCFLYVHGFLHLLGYDHMNEDEEKEMLAKQQTILERAGIVR